MDRSRKPKHTPRKQSEEELKLVRRMRKKYGKDVILGYQRACERGCNHRISPISLRPSPLSRAALGTPWRTSGSHTASRLRLPIRAAYPGEKIQIDVKYVPTYCIVRGEKYYQYTATDECSRWTYREMYAEHSAYSSRDFLEKLIRAAPFPIRMAQTDNGSEFTSFEHAFLDMGIAYRRIRIATPRHNGKIERQYRTDGMRFYERMRMFSLADGRRQLAVYQRHANDIIMTCLGMKSLNQILDLYRGVMEQASPSPMMFFGLSQGRGVFASQISTLPLTDSRLVLLWGLVTDV